MHRAVKNFCLSMKETFPGFFFDKDVLDCGSIDINGNNRYLFDNCSYTGIDIIPGKNVDHVSYTHDFKSAIFFDVIISTEMLEHDRFYKKSLQQMYQLLKPGGLLLITAAGTNRPMHGTSFHSPKDSPATLDYYKNLTASVFTDALYLEDFSFYNILYVGTDIFFAGKKRIKNENAN
jgi:SAM-dependent methyltransferase